MNLSLAIKRSLKTNDWILAQILKSKKKDFVNPFRKMMYDTQEEMDTVLGTLENIPFLDAAKQDHLNFVSGCKELIKRFKSNKQIIK